MNSIIVFGQYLDKFEEFFQEREINYSRKVDFKMGFLTTNREVELFAREMTDEDVVELFSLFGFLCNGRTVRIIVEKASNNDYIYLNDLLGESFVINKTWFD